VLAALGACRAPSETPAEEDASRLVRGSLATRYRGRTGGGEHDQDAYAVLALDAGEAGRTPWSGYLLAEAGADIDGHGSTNAFASVGDAEHAEGRARLYEAYADHNGSGWLERARLGRQIDYETPVIVTYDGLSLRTAESTSNRAQFELYGGVPARIDSHAESGDLVVGASGAFRPWENGRVRADFMHVEDQAYFGHASDDLFAIDLRQRVSRGVDVQGSASALNGEARDVRAAASYADEDGDFVTRASFYRLLETQNELALEFDPYTNVLLALEPYSQAVLMASKELWKDVRLEGGLDFRHVDDSGDEGPFNRDFERAYVHATIEDLFTDGLTAGFTADHWNAGTDEANAIGMYLAHQLGAHGRATIGTAYALYQYDLFSLEERDHVRTWYVAYSFRRREALSWDVRWDHEDSFHDYDTLRLGVTWWF
jgi:hypothetical protein